MIVIPFTGPQGVGSVGKQQALMRFSVLLTFVWALGTSKGRIANLRLLRMDFYKGQPGCCLLTGDWWKSEASAEGLLCPLRKFQVARAVDNTQLKHVVKFVSFCCCLLACFLA